MSKSENQMATLYLADDDATIRKKISKAKTDSGGNAAVKTDSAGDAAVKADNAGNAAVKTNDAGDATIMTNSAGDAPEDVQGETLPTMPVSVANLFQLLKLVCPADTYDKFQTDYRAGTIRYGDMKKELAEGMVQFISPIREKAEAIRNDEPYLRQVMEQGAAKARASAGKTLQLAKDAIGLTYY